MFIKRILEIFFPNHCLYCKDIISSNALFCSTCWLKLQFITQPKCKICSYPFETAGSYESLNLICPHCLTKPPSYDKVLTIFHYNQIIGKIISDLKYRDQTFISKKLASFLFTKFKLELENIDIATVVPLHKNKIRKRKFNQSALIAKNLLKHFPQKKLLLNLIKRSKDTKAQAFLRQKERRKNLKNAFILNENYQNLIKNQTILLIDDVMTTGTTLESCAKILKKHGAKKIIILTIAKTVFTF